MTYPVFPDVKKIAIFRATALGDFIFALQALQALHNAYPQAELVYLGRAWHAAFLPGRLPGKHRVIAIPPARGADIARGLVTDPEEEDAVLSALKAEHFDLAVQLHGAGEYSNPFVLALGARHTVGMKSQRAIAPERWIPYTYYQHEVARTLEVVGLAGAAVPSTQFLPRLPVLESDLEAAAPVLSQLKRPFAVIHPGSTDPRRCWSPEKFAQVGDACAEHGLQVVITGTSMEAAQMRTVQERMHAPAINLCDQLSLPGLVGLLSKASLFVGNDSGPLHLAMAVGGRAVGLFWVEYILNSMPLTRERFYPLIAWNRTCPKCGKYCKKPEIDEPMGPCTHEVSFVEEISAEEVVKGVETLWSY